MSYFSGDLSSTIISVEENEVQISTYSNDFTQLLGEKIVLIEDLCEVDRAFIKGF